MCSEGHVQTPSTGLRHPSSLPESDARSVGHVMSGLEHIDG